MHTTPRAKRSTSSILLQWATVVVFFLPIWLAYAYEISPGLSSDRRAVWDIAVPVGAFFGCVVLSFAYQAWRRIRARDLPTVP